MNGDLSEWQGAANLTLRSQDGRGEHDNHARVMLTWDEQKLYVAFTVWDTELHASHGSDDGALWHDDGVEVLVDTRADGARTARLGEQEFLARGGRIGRGNKRLFLDDNDYQVIVNIRGSVLTGRGVELDPEEQSWTTDIFRAVKLAGTPNNNTDTDSGYAVELGVPWKALGVRPKPGRVMAADFGIHDIDSEDGQRFGFDWAGIRPFKQPDKWRRIRLVAGGAARGIGDLRLPVGIAAAATMAALLLLLWYGQRRRARLTIPTKTGSVGHREILAGIDSFIEQNYSSPTLNATQAAKHFCVSQGHLLRILRTGGRPAFHEMVRRARTARAEELLVRSDKSVTEIAFEVGFRQPAAFYPAFKANTGLTPTEYRKKHVSRL